MFVLRVRVSVFVHYYEKYKQNKQVSRYGRMYDFLSNELTKGGLKKTSQKNETPHPTFNTAPN